ncbi:uncharacterized protein LOC131160576 [Malania oleifera]|uniref:uncharacterized protein LOC131160576 n=1 Tax=Malania oleifera TaxID=397392 RepID=UPI0025AE9959|nr:uncharacterized protein LOC131160576 [Malania oleifera]
MSECAGNTIAENDREMVALNVKCNSKDDEDPNLVQNVQKLKKEMDDNCEVSTVCFFYNFTGDTATFVDSKVWDIPAVAPPCKDIKDGRRLFFMHRRTLGTAVVYRGKNAAEDECDWMLAWSNLQQDHKLVNKVYTEINEAHHYDDDHVWKAIARHLYESGQSSTATWNGCMSTLEIKANGCSRTLTAFLKHTA